MLKRILIYSTTGSILREYAHPQDSPEPRNMPRVLKAETVTEKSDGYLGGPTGITFYKKPKETKRWRPERIVLDGCEFEVQPLSGGKVKGNGTLRAVVLTPEQAEPVAVLDLRIADLKAKLAEAQAERKAYLWAAARQARPLTKADTINPED